MSKTRIKALIVAAVMAVGLLGGVTTAYAEEDTFNYMDAWNNIHGSYASGNDGGLKVEERPSSVPGDTATDPVTGFEKEISVTEGDSEKTESTDNSVSGAGSLISGSESVGNYISSDVTIGQNSTPDLNIDFNLNGSDTGNMGLFTPDGNLTLVDDLDAVEGASLQYMTVQTKNGTTFYIIIDRTADKDNVYFLNSVDAVDLMALMDDDTKAKFQTDTEAQAKSNTQPADNTDTDNTKKQDEKADKKDSGANPFGTLLIFVILGGGGAGAYYFFKIKPQKAQVRNDDDDMEFEDDEEYDMQKAEADDVDADDTAADSTDEDEDDSEDDLDDEEDY